MTRETLNGHIAQADKKPELEGNLTEAAPPPQVENHPPQIDSKPPLDGNLTEVDDRPIADSETGRSSSRASLTGRRGFSARRIGMVLLGGMLIAGVVVVGLRAKAPSQKPDRLGGKGAQITPVAVAEAVQKTVPVQLQAIGSVQAQNTVSVTPQASGRITTVHFQKGQKVNKGQLLFTLDDRTQRAAIEQAQGVVAKDRALVQQARATLEKDTGQIQQARATMEKDMAAVEQARATLQKDTGLIQQAKVTLQKDTGLVRQAEATLTKDRASSQYAQAQNNRYSGLYKEGAISQDQAQQYATSTQTSAATLQVDQEAIQSAQAVVAGDRVAIQNAEAVVAGDRMAIESAQAVVRGDAVAIQNAEAVVKGDLAAIQNAEAVVKADEGSLKNAEALLSYTKIYAPMAGLAGDILVTEGNVVQPSNNTALVKISQINPIQVEFSVPETNLSEVQKYAQNGKLPVDINFPNNINHPIKGALSFVNNTVDTTTGTIQLSGEFDNTEGKLFPGQYVNATLTLTQEPNATVIPDRAVQNGPNGQFVFVVKPDMTVENQPVTIGPSINGLDVIRKGIKPGDRVVIDGQANLVSGSKISIKTRNNSNSAPNSDSQTPEKSNSNPDQTNAVNNSTSTGNPARKSGRNRQNTK
ncbi:efflux RND transporter periplasmic adaptor subunit [Microcoleus anatoxicus]|uniref:Efflux RND transporter periplasmic adaptor subunit n=1 Tax=Microcoleus anatoxicus PTRS2 TaxID=2705321 RepID=A0ABU8YH08_9CYAN